MALQLSGDIAGLGKIVQIVRATDTTARSTTSGSFVDASISVTITPQKSDSAVIILHHAVCQITGTAGYARFQISDSSNNALSGAEDIVMGSSSNDGSAFTFTNIGYATPATTSAVTYKARFRRNGSTETITLLNDATNATGQMYAIEVAA